LCAETTVGKRAEAAEHGPTGTAVPQKKKLRAAKQAKKEAEEKKEREKDSRDMVKRYFSYHP